MQVTTENNSALNTALNNAHQLLQEGLHKEGFAHLSVQLHEITKNLPQEVIDNEIREECLQHPVAKILLQEPMTKWSYQKPRGYSGDATLIDYMYRLKPCSLTDSYAGRELYGQINQIAAAQAVRWRASHVAEEIQKLQTKLGKKIDVISVASGHLRELAYIPNADEKINRFVCLDQDAQSNQLVRTTYGHHSFMEIIDDSISYILKGKLKEQQFDFIYSSGLFDYLNDKLASKMIERLYENLKPGGVLIVPNFLKGIMEKAYMDTFMKWNLIYRNEEDMLDLCQGLTIPTKDKEIYYDEVKRVVYLKIHKPN